MDNISNLSWFSEYTLGDKDGVIKTHQIRATCNEDDMGSPASEGIHNDGFIMWVAVAYNVKILMGDTLCLLLSSDKVYILIRC
ncbi:MAG: hypothetical protein ACI8VC_001515 [Candidatus Endobugula sp.]